MRKLVLVLTVLGCIAFGFGCGKQDESEHKGQEVVPEIVQKTCPVMEGKINPELYVDHNGRRIYFCCQGCVDTFKKDPEKYMKKVDEDLAKSKEAR